MNKQHSPQENHNSNFVEVAENQMGVSESARVANSKLLPSQEADTSKSREFKEGQYVRKKHNKKFNDKIDGIEGNMIHTNEWGWRSADDFIRTG